MPHILPRAPPLRVLTQGLAKASRATLHHFHKHVGAGIICAIAYFDPGNWSVDLQAGSNFGYRPMLFVILMAGAGAIVLQTLAARLGCVTGLDLASHCRLLLYNRTRRPRLVRYLVLYPLYVLSEVAIISTDLAELLGSAIGFCLIFPKLPLYGGVLVTAADVLLFLAISDPYKGQGRPVRTFELVIIGLVFTVFACFVVLLVKSKPDWDNVFLGYIPDKTLLKSQPDAVYTAVGILGATVMPHALFLGSSLATQDRVSSVPITTDAGPSEGGFKAWTRRLLKSMFKVSRADRGLVDDTERDYRAKQVERENNSISFIRRHLTHAVVDVVTSLLFLAVPINSAILIIAANVFYTGPDQQHAQSVGLFDAHDLIKSRISSGAAFVFALALVCAGQASSVTVTLAGQLVSEGFIEWRISPFLRRFITRLISLVPSVVVAVAVGKDGINTLLVASQVILSLVLPFVAFPLIYLTSSQKVMRVRKVDPDDPVESTRAGGVVPPKFENTNDNEISCEDRESHNGPGLPPTDVHDQHSDDFIDTIEPTVQTSDTVDEKCLATPKRLGPNQDNNHNYGFLYYSSSKFVVCLAYAIWCIVLVANAYAIAMLVVQWVN